MIETTGKTIDDAIAAALRELGADRDSVTVEVLEKPKSGFLGIGGSPARVRVKYFNEDIPSVSRAAQASAKTVVQEPSKPKATEPATHKEQPKPAVKTETSTVVKTEQEKRTQPKPAETPRNNTPRPAVRERRRYNEPQEPVSEERIAEIKGFLSGLLERMNIKSAEIDAKNEERCLLLTVSGPDMGRLIGRHGDTLDSVQRLVSSAANKGHEKSVRIVVDAESYRQKREEALISLAQKSAEKALKYRRNMVLEPMNSYARHVIHAALQDMPGIATHSVGTEPARRVVISVPGGDNRQRRPQHRD